MHKRIILLKRHQKVLNHGPHKKATIQRVFITTPKKPHSAKRKTAQALLSTGYSIILYLQGEDVRIQRYGQILIRPGRIRDLPGVRFKGIRGKYDYKVFKPKTKQRSLVGIKKIK